jgi:hypothetical protein
MYSIRLYIGFSYNGIILTDGIDIDSLKQSLFQIYDMIKK